MQTRSISFCRQLGDEWSVKPEVIMITLNNLLVQCTCTATQKKTSANAMRMIMLKQMIGDDEALHLKSRVDLTRLPPCKDSLIPHIYRVNYRISLYKKASNAIFESPILFDLCQGWEKTEDKKLEPI